MPEKALFTPQNPAHLLTNGSCHRDWEGPDIPAAQVLTFPLVAEKFQLSLFLLIQGVAISDLNRHREYSMEEVALAP